MINTFGLRRVRITIWIIYSRLKKQKTKTPPPAPYLYVCTCNTTTSFRYRLGRVSVAVRWEKNLIVFLAKRFRLGHFVFKRIWSYDEDSAAAATTASSSIRPKRNRGEIIIILITYRPRDFNERTYTRAVINRLLYSRIYKIYCVPRLAAADTRETMADYLLHNLLSRLSKISRRCAVFTELMLFNRLHFQPPLAIYHYDDLL